MIFCYYSNGANFLVENLINFNLISKLLSWTLNSEYSNTPEICLPKYLELPTEYSYTGFKNARRPEPRGGIPV